LRLFRGGRPLPLVAAFALVLAPGAALAAPHRPVPATVLIVTDVGESARRSMPAALWRKLATDYVGRAASAEDGTALPDDARCRSAHAQYAVFATFERATRLPGLALDTDRAYGIARFTVRNCVTGAVAPVKAVRVESDPLPTSDIHEDENAAQTWERAVRATLAREPSLLPREPLPPAAAAAPSARVVRVDNDLVVLHTSATFAMNQVLRDVADANGKPHPPFEMVVVELAGKYVIAHVTGNHTAHPGDYVEVAK
jgi:hypothetical protein